MNKIIHYSSPTGTIILRQGLERLAYLQGDGTAYIDTGTKLNYSSVNNIRVICTNDFEDNKSAPFIGTNSYFTGFMALYHCLDNYIYDRYITGKYYKRYNIPVGNKINFYMQVDYKNLKCSYWLNGKKDINRTITKGTDLSNICFFRGSINHYPATKCKCYEVSINIDGGDQKYFIPVRVKSDVTIAGTSYSAGILGMYDYNNDKLYTNVASSGEFIAGPECPQGFPTSEYCQVEWLEGVSQTSTLIPCYRRSDLQSGTYNLSTRIFTAVNGKMGPSITFGWGEVMNGAYIEPIQTSLSLPDRINNKLTNAIPHNISSGEGRFGINTAFDFSVTNAYINTNGLSTGKTYMGWFYTASKPTREVFFVDNSSGMAFGINDNGTKAIISTANASNKVFTLSTWNTGWNHITVVKADNGPQLYINGIVQTATSSTNGWIHSGGLWIGARSTFDGNFSGRCQDFKVFDTAIT